MDNDGIIIKITGRLNQNYKPMDLSEKSQSILEGTIIASRQHQQLP
jgi:hypothetical protein